MPRVPGMEWVMPGLLYDRYGNPLQTADGALFVYELMPATRRVAEPVICDPNNGLTVPAGGSAAGYIQELRYFSRKCAWVVVAGAEVTCTLKVGLSPTDASQHVVPEPAASFTWTLGIGSHLIVIPADLQVAYGHLHFTNATGTAATVTGYWQLKEA